MILVGQYDSPFVRRVAVALRQLGFDYTHDMRSVFGDFDDMRRTNPVGRIPSLILDDGTVLIDSVAILDWLDEMAGPGRALLPESGVARRQALQITALAVGAVDKAGAAAYERLIRPTAYRWPDWIERCRIQATGAIAALEAAGLKPSAQPGIPEITAVCMLRYVRMTDRDLAPIGSYPRLDALADALEALPAFQATYPPDIAYPNEGNV